MKKLLLALLLIVVFNGVSLSGEVCQITLGYVFPDYNDLKTYIMAINRGEDQIFLFHQYNKQGKAEETDITSGYSSVVRILRISQGIAMVQDVVSKKVSYVPAEYVKCGNQ